MACDASSAAASSYSSLGLDAKLGTVGTLGFSALSGGIGEAVSGGNFWHGAGVGLTTSSLNHAQHAVEEYKFFWRLKKHYDEGSGKDFRISGQELKYLAKKGQINYSKENYMGKGLYSATINFYDSDKDLALSFGRATIYYNRYKNKYTYIDFYDKYDFDPKNWGERSRINEIITRTYNMVSDGKSFHIYHNKIRF